MPYVGAPWRLALLAVYVPSVVWVGALTYYTVFVRGGVGKNRSTVAVRYLPALRPPLQPSIIHSTPLRSTPLHWHASLQSSCSLVHACSPVHAALLLYESIQHVQNYFSTLTGIIISIVLPVSSLCLLVTASSLGLRFSTTFSREHNHTDTIYVHLLIAFLSANSLGRIL